MEENLKELLLKDLSGRIPYGVIVYSNGLPHEQKLTGYIPDIEHYHIKPYLRPMSSMTRQECTQLNVLLPRYFTVYPDRLYCLEHINGGIINFEVLDTIVDFYNSHHLDWRGLIPKGLALEAKEGMYNIK